MDFKLWGKKMAEDKPQEISNTFRPALNSVGQVIIPIKLREKHNLKDGMRIELEFKGVIKEELVLPKSDEKNV